MKKVIFVSVALLSLTGCMSTPKHGCPLNDQDGRCASLDQAYRAAAAVDDVSQFQNVFDAGERTTARQAKSFAQQGYGQPAERGKPVFVPPKVHRAWTAPWTDAEGQLHGGEYLYFTTPGKWSYGSLRSPGEASGVFKPVMTGTYGFVPVSPKQRERKDAAVPNSSQAQPAEVRNAVRTVNGVTQPQETLSE